MNCSNKTIASNRKTKQKFTNKSLFAKRSKAQEISGSFHTTESRTINVMSNNEQWRIIEIFRRKFIMKNIQMENDEPQSIFINQNFCYHSTFPKRECRIETCICNYSLRRKNSFFVVC